VNTERASRSAGMERPLGISLLVAFFCFGAVMCTLTIGLLLFPGTSLDAAWRLNPTAQSSFATIGRWAIAIMLIIGIGCAAAAVGLAKCARWGRRLALTILFVNMLGDCANAIVRADWRTLIGLPIAGLMIFYLMGTRVRRCFDRNEAGMAPGPRVTHKS
jgi:hypothetical protein